MRSLARTPRDLYRTHDGGATWSALLRDAPPWSSIDFETLDRGWAAPERGAQLVTTTDGGRTWQAVEVPNPAPHRSLPLNAWKVQVDGNVVVAFSGQTTGNFFTPFFDVSSDGGRTWRRSRGPRALLHSQPNAFDAADADHWALAWSKYLYITDDGGKTWVERAESAGINSIEDIARLDANVAFISGIADSSNQPVVLKTTDAGEAWAPVR